MTYGFKFGTGNGGVTEISDADRPTWFYMGSFQDAYDPYNSSQAIIANPMGYTKFFLQQTPNGDGLTWGTVSRSGSVGAPPMEALWAAMSTPTFSISGSDVVVAMAPNPMVGNNVDAGAGFATYTCKLFGQY